MTFLTVNYCKGISTIIQLQNNANGVLRIYHLSESSVIGALKEIKFQFMYVNFIFNKCKQIIHSRFCQCRQDDTAYLSKRGEIDVVLPACLAIVDEVAEAP